MRLHIVHDGQGKILAAAEVSQKRKGGMLIPRASHGQVEAELDVPKQFETLELREIVRQLYVDTKSDPPSLVPIV